MSLSFSDRVEVFLGPQAVRGVLRPKGWRPAPGAPVEVACAGAPGQVWQAAVAALAEVLARLGGKGAAVEVTLSNHFVRYALVPPLPGVRRVDRVALAQHQMHAVYGEAARPWRIAVGDSPSRGNALAGAVEPALVEAIESAVRNAGHRPVAVQPYLVAAYNACCARMGAEPAWLAAAEAGRVCVAAVRDGEWLALRSQRIGTSLRDALPGLLEQTRLASGQDAPPGEVLLVSRDEPAFELRGDGGWSLAPVAWSH